MGCVNSTSRKHTEEEYIETLTLKRKVTKKVKGQSVKISISVITDPNSDNEDTTLAHDLSKSATDHEICEYHLETLDGFNTGRRFSKRHSFRTISVFEGKRLTKFPKTKSYQICNDCKENKDDVHKTVHDDVDMDLCRKCSVKTRKAKKNVLTSEKLGDASVGKINIAAFASLLALTALDLTAPASDAILKNRKNTWIQLAGHPGKIQSFLATLAIRPAGLCDAILKNRKNTWIQLAGHPGGFAPAGPNTIWKKRYTKDNNETKAYQELMDDSAHCIVPMYYREVEYNSEYFIEIEDLLQHFHDPNIMDIKLGTRTFLESEVKNTTLRRDLYEKMVALDPEAPTENENESQSITKLRYMQFREAESSTSNYGFRIEAVRMSGEPPTTNLKKVKSKDQILAVLSKYINKHETVRESLIRRLEEIRITVEASTFFHTHEIIGSSVLVLYDKEEKCGAWLIDFSKTSCVPLGTEINHRSPWQLGNHEDGLLLGLDNITKLLKDLQSYKESTTESSTSSHSSSENSS